MPTKTVRISDKVYRRLFETAGQLQSKFKRPVSIDETLDMLLKRFGENRILDLAGSWEMSEKEVKGIKESLKEGWKKWDI